METTTLTQPEDLAHLCADHLRGTDAAVMDIVRAIVHGPMEFPDHIQVWTEIGGAVTEYHLAADGRPFCTVLDGQPQ